MQRQQVGTRQGVEHALQGRVVDHAGFAPTRCRCSDRQCRGGGAHEVAGARPRLHAPFAFQLQAGLHCRCRADAVIGGQLPDRGQALAGTQGAAFDLLPQLGGQRFVQEHVRAPFICIGQFAAYLNLSWSCAALQTGCAR